MTEQTLEFTPNQYAAMTAYCEAHGISIMDFITSAVVGKLHADTDYNSEIAMQEDAQANLTNEKQVWKSALYPDKYVLWVSNDGTVSHFHEHPMPENTPHNSGLWIEDINGTRIEAYVFYDGIWKWEDFYHMNGIVHQAIHSFFEEKSHAPR